MCRKADERFTLMKKAIIEGSITFRDMEFILEKQAEVKRLCTANEVDVLNKVLSHRKVERAAFRDYKTRLDSYCSKLKQSKVDIPGEQIY